VENLGENHRAARKDRTPVLCNCRKPQLSDMTSIDQVLQDPFEPGSGDRQCLRLQLANCLADRSDGPGAPRTVLPSAPAESSLYRLELQARSHSRALDPLG